jgi:ketosteroid isomerase-like protein
MSQENVEIIRAGFEGYTGGDIGAMLKSADPDLVTQRWSPLPDPAIYHGLDGLLQMITDWIENFEEFEASVEEYIDVSDHHVITRVRQQAIGAGSGVPIEAEFWFLWTLRNRRYVRLDLYLSKAEALEAVGQSE